MMAVLRIRKKIKSYWLGKEPLWKAFWLIGVLAHIIMTVVAIAFAAFLISSVYGSYDETSGSPQVSVFYKLISFVMFALFFFYYIFSTVSVWRCAENSKALRKTLARIIVIIVALATSFEFANMIIISNVFIGGSS